MRIIKNLESLIQKLMELYLFPARNPSQYPQTCDAPITHHQDISSIFGLQQTLKTKAITLIILITVSLLLKKRPMRLWEMAIMLLIIVIINADVAGCKSKNKASNKNTNT